jgi:hypothetical protein
LNGSRKQGKLTKTDGTSQDGEWDVDDFVNGTEYNKDGKIIATYQNRIKTIVEVKPDSKPEVKKATPEMLASLEVLRNTLADLLK